jgi:hypothetical protein
LIGLVDPASQLLKQTTEEGMKRLSERITPGDETGAIGYILMWLMGVPASILFVIFLLRGCN